MKHHTVKFANWLKWSNLSNILTISIATSLFVVLVVIFLSLKRRRKLTFFQNKWPMSSTSSTIRISIKNIHSKNDLCEAHPTHNWYMYDLFTKPTYCNICECVMVSGLCCIYCNLCADEKCIKKADKNFKCKMLFMVKDFSTSIEQLNYNHKWQHHWIKGNLKLNSECFICTDLCEGGPNLHDYKCAWCHVSAHESCLNNVSRPALVDECNLSRLILKPNLIYFNLPNGKNTTASLINLNDIKINDLYLKNRNQFDNEFTPLFVFCNLKSGNNDADEIIRILTGLLNPLQIIEMNQKSVDMALKWIESYSNLIKFKILVCGGDGSVGWILSSISKLDFKKYEPAIGILPLGTGNDLSRRLKWGQGYVGDVDIEEILHEIDQAKYVKLDRWAIKISKLSSKLLKKSIEESNQLDTDISSKLSKTELKFMNNYISVGCDALVTLNFHKNRENLFFANRLLNKLIYFKYGTIDTFLKECRLLTENIQLELDGKVIELPHLESIVVLNIPFWGGGVDPWNIGRTKSDDLPQPNIDDGLLEVFGVYSSFHIAQLQVSLAEPYRIGQARHVRIKMLKRFPVQIDGEPWEQSPAVIDISFNNQVTMLEKNDSEFS